MSKPPFDKLTFYAIEDKNAAVVAAFLKKKFGIVSIDISRGELPHCVDFSSPFIIINGDGYKHDLTLDIVSSINKLVGNFFDYLHVDLHEDRSTVEGKNYLYATFVNQIANANLVQRAYWLSPDRIGLAGKLMNAWKLWDGALAARDFLQKQVSPSKAARARPIYTSIDLDYSSDIINTQFPGETDSPIQEMEGLIRVIDWLPSSRPLIGADITGYSDFVYRNPGIRIDNDTRERSLEAIGRITKHMAISIAKSRKNKDSPSFCLPAKSRA